MVAPVLGVCLVAKQSTAFARCVAVMRALRRLRFGHLGAIGAVRAAVHADEDLPISAAVGSGTGGEILGVWPSRQFIF
jgi:hypothetical protein